MASRHAWKHEESSALIDIWKEKFFLLKNKKGTAHVYEEIKEALAARGIHKSVRQIILKIGNMTRKYRKMKSEGEQSSSWIYFERLDRFLGKAESNPVKKEVIKKSNKFQDIITLDEISASVPQNQNAHIQTDNIQESHQELDSSPELLNENPAVGLVDDRQNEMLSVLKHFLSVQEKVVDLIRSVQDNSSKSGI
ncbi:hypothetical protein HNY73_012498 [Argiope bruennichi]|uniref:Myb/SANT-like DNA-binding domain-containing protein n=1 Tax=Argiope bruennichi TaxID=94029 RepID=A0A8T0EV29_ARGBR|nr:hypothetical protein HNY73_012498 [Argiope bruennichi]